MKALDRCCRSSRWGKGLRLVVCCGSRCKSSAATCPVQARNLATELMAGASESDSSFAIFGVTITLTPLGLEQVDEVVKMTMQYMQMIREAGPQKWVWDECQATAAMSFRYKSKENPGNYATSVARQMHQYPPELTLSGPSLYFEYVASFHFNLSALVLMMTRGVVLQL